MRWLLIACGTAAFSVSAAAGQPVRVQTDPGSSDSADPAAASASEPDVPSLAEIQAYGASTPAQEDRRGVADCLLTSTCSREPDGAWLRERARAELERESFYRDLYSGASSGASEAGDCSRVGQPDCAMASYLGVHSDTRRTDPKPASSGDGGDVVQCDDLGCTNALGWRNRSPAVPPLESVARDVRDAYYRANPAMLELLSPEERCERQGYMPQTPGFVRCVGRKAAPLPSRSAPPPAQPR